LDKLDKPKLLKKGAEASIYFSNWYGKEIVIKSRNVKNYRHPKLDEKIRRFRTMHEPQLMNEAKKAGVSTPTIYLVDTKKMLIFMEFIHGKQIKHILMNLSKVKRQNMCFNIGKLVAKLHISGIIHGDLTTSNFILNDYNKLILVDFGLAEKQIETEAKGVDLHLMKRGLQSTHNQFAEDCFRKIMDGYSKIVGDSFKKVIFKKIREIELRGRYIEERKIK
jgi:TP53 regulating kinase-like protein